MVGFTINDMQQRFDKSVSAAFLQTYSLETHKLTPRTSENECKRKIR
jgi:hypothetical protein